MIEILEVKYISDLHKIHSVHFWYIYFLIKIFFIKIATPPTFNLNKWRAA